MLKVEETELRAIFPAYVGSFNQPAYLEQMVETLLQNGFSNIIVADNASSSEKLLRLLDRLDMMKGVTVWRQDQNVGPTETVNRIVLREPKGFIFTDPDLELSPVLPADFLRTLFRVSAAYRCRKVGLALEIPPPGTSRELVFDLHGARYTVQEWESQFWETQLEPDVYRANVDTTFFLWNPRIVIDARRSFSHFRKHSRIGRRLTFLPRCEATDIRVARPGFVARHLPWYKDDKFPEDERDFYKQSATRASTWLRDSQ